MFDIRVSQHSVVRTPELVARSAGDFYKLSLQLRGSTLLLQDGKEALLLPGDMALYDTTRPYTLVSDGRHAPHRADVPPRLPSTSPPRTSASSPPRASRQTGRCARS